MTLFTSPSRLAVLGSMLMASSLPAAEASPETMVKEASQIDRLVDSILESSGRKAPVEIDDSTFLRRASLVAIGRIPTLEENRTYMGDPAEYRRSRLVSRLYYSKGYESHMNNWMFDHFRLTEDKLVGGYFSSNSPLVNWMRQAVRENRSWNLMAKELLSSRGNGWLGSGASHYFTRDLGMPLDNASNTIRAFLGIRLECAQCHDDPKSEWEQMDFYNLAAFTHGKGNYGSNFFLSGRGLFVKMSADEEYNAKGLGHLHFFSDAIGQYAASGIEPSKGTGRIPLPGDYKYAGAKPGEMVEASTPMGERLILSSKEDTTDSLERFASWVIDDRNPSFAGSIAARMWYRVMGTSLDQGDNEEFLDLKHPVTGELSRHLVSMMKRYDYDLRSFQQTLMLTRAFSVKAAPDAEASFHGLMGRPIERMSAEQIWDSLVTLNLKDPESVQRDEMIEHLFYKGRYIGRLDETIRKVHSFESKKEYQDWVIMKYHEARDGTGPEAPVSPPATYISGHGRLMTSAVTGVARASELPSPAPPNHFLAKFGQSDRVSSDSATREGSLTQTLQLLNGITQKMAMRSNNPVIKGIFDKPGNHQEKASLLFRTLLTRDPSKVELDQCVRELEERRGAGVANIISALVCTPEFLFIY